MNDKFNIKKIDGHTFLEYKEGDISIYFSTAENDLDFNKNSELGINNLNNIRKWFLVEKVTYLNQIHSDKVFKGDSNDNYGDALITNDINNAIGVFTADCVPIILIDSQNKAVAAIHSGWKGTLHDVVIKTIEEMINTYNTDVSTLKVLIGPHIRKCCFEVGYDIIELFNKNMLFTKEMVRNNKFIDLEGYIVSCLNNAGVDAENIILTNICTHCTSKFQMHSYRKNKLNYGRMFSFVVIKK